MASVLKNDNQTAHTAHWIALLRELFVRRYIIMETSDVEFEPSLVWKEHTRAQNLMCLGHRTLGMFIGNHEGNDKHSKYSIQNKVIDLMTARMDFFFAVRKVAFSRNKLEQPNFP